jgi:hypothetical protein
LLLIFRFFRCAVCAVSYVSLHIELPPPWPNDVKPSGTLKPLLSAPNFQELP